VQIGQGFLAGSEIPGGNSHMTKDVELLNERPM
jgi:hypothetical protein